MFYVGKNCPSKLLFKNSNIEINNYISLQATNKKKHKQTNIHTMTYVKINKKDKK